jgi:hypothetical protein
MLWWQKKRIISTGTHLPRDFKSGEARYKPELTQFRNKNAEYENAGCPALYWKPQDTILKIPQHLEEL